MPRVLRTTQAEIDLLDIWCSVGQESITAADKLLESLEKKFQTLSIHPQMGRIREEFSRSLRSFSTGTYVIFYKPIEDGIEVIRVLHGARDIESLL